ncbi:MAG: phosphoribosylaminoimidazolesuccinocarboxamide synthase [Aquirufa antheringensis]|jgi:phosphoribosylaminoimidazole-succinocarboxamide synthase|uniref:phosphoribosylaminoimidazolesuccinocarboxamide synthase n=1 Tax=Aquirufa antheringensis TaxID=2516559 RepID=UPI00208ECE73|nr:phosphoribosylaminoimidazolesuccinocarboxamide synthase [Aquirufa antheringensis]MCL9968528.1 phosphoribosylaminoimidazolesuccinocarboxamide synthase [Aquirufa antheringensis]MCZ2486003.1 phosphoribosylaminoimidazolesuccinocarboxamide synthase [Aquirufa antheringensis]MCZ2486306.1 phosphoribosylaminoimidazolesuccinocarboxamide synthase [Aquirufa antheringensis]MCZ2488913.1 phosphoribosylaminoimidazolesuccinocarboxamide synthase [Aquirufa antheringensis]USQ04495.1 phosphoribosylaminoimidazol
MIPAPYQFPNQTSFYRGKVRDVYGIGDHLLMITSDRISAFDVVLPKLIPFKGQVLNQIASYFLQKTADIVPNWLVATPDPNAAYGLKCEPFAIEMVIRGYLVGHLWREYKAGKRSVCGVTLPDGLVENQQLPSPIITPTTKASEGHDEDISVAAIIEQGIVSRGHMDELCAITHQLFLRGQEMAAEKNLILVDTKYEFGLYEGKIMLMDEIHTPDSSRYFYKEPYAELFAKGEAQKQLSKEFVREWLIANGFQGKEGQNIPTITDEFVQQISERYILLYEEITGLPFHKEPQEDIYNRIYNNTIQYLQHV